MDDPASNLPPEAPAAQAGRGRPLRAYVASVAVIAALGWITWHLIGPGSNKPPSTSESPAPADLSLPAAATSPFLNTRPEARYLGSQACQRCHPESHESYSHSGMSRSMAEVDPALEPEDTVFEHHASGRRITVHRHDGQLRQRDELTKVGEYGDVELADHPLRFVVGSGHFSKTYLAEIDGFLAEAPLTWFASTGKWGMSPGYDHAAQQGFSRPVIERCVACHAGSAEAVEGTVQKLRFQELTIGCERCHGPGSVHVDFWNAHRSEGTRAANPGQIDHTIVNPAHLSRELAEAICQQCHLTPEAEVTARGRSLAEFRPGLPLQDYLLMYRRQVPETSMTVVGHVDQLALSRCYQKSETLTCMTCHNPHENPAPEERPAYYRAICLECHQLADCRVDPAERLAKSADNDCARCHMPVGPTEIIHLAFTHHRIGIHTPETKKPGQKEPERREEDEPPESVEHLEPIHDLARLGEVDRLRGLGLAYYDHAALQGGPRAEVELERAQALLERVRKRGLHDGQVDAALAQIIQVRGDPLAPVLAAEALNDPLLPADPRSGVLYILANDLYNKGQVDEAVRQMGELLRLRRNATNWILLGNCELKRKNYAAATEAFEQAVSVDPKQIAAHRTLAQLYGVSGKETQARREWAIADRLEKILKGPGGVAPLPASRSK